MSEQPKIELQDVLNTSEGRFEYIGEDTLVSRVGCSLFFFSLSTHKQHAMRFPAGYSLDAFTVSNQTTSGHGEQQIVVALSGEDTRIHVYSWPRLHLEQSFITDTEVAYSRLALSRDGRFLAGITTESHVHLRFWDLQSPDINIQINDDPDNQTNRLLRDREVRLVLQEEMTFLSFNPFNHTQIVVGNEKSVTVLTVTAATSFQLATLTPQSVLLDVNNLNQRRVNSTLWLNDHQLLIATKDGEILSCQMVAPPSVLAIREREIAAQQAQQNLENPGLDRSVSGSTPLGFNPNSPNHNHNNAAAAVPPAEIEIGLSHLTSADIAMLGLVDPNAPVQNRIDWKNEENKGWLNSTLNVSVWAGNLPFAPEHEENEEEKMESPAASKGRVGSVHRSQSANGAVALCMALTRHEVVLGTDDGCLLWLNKQNQSVVQQQHIDVSTAGDAGILFLTFSPSYSTFVALTHRGHLRLFKPMSDRATPSSTHHTDVGEEKTQAAFQTSSLGYFPLASALAPSNPTSPLSYASLYSTLPQSLLKNTRVPIRVGHALIPTHPSDLNPRNFKLVSYSSTGTLQLWCYGTRSLLGTYHFKSGITSCTVTLDGHLALVGLDSGVVNIVDISNPSYMRLVFSERFHSGPVLAIEFNKEGDLFATLGPKKVFFVRTGDFRVVGYTKLSDWQVEKRNSEEEEKEKLAELIENGVSSNVNSGLTSGLSRQNADAEAAKAAQMALEAEKAKHDDEDEAAVVLSNTLDVTGVTTESKDSAPATPPVPTDTLLSMCWSSPVDREKQPNDRLVISTRKGYVVVITAPNLYHDAHELKLTPEFLSPVVTKLDNNLSLLTLQPNLSDRTVIYATSSSKLLQVYNLQYDSTFRVSKSLNSDLPQDGVDVEEIGADGLLHQRPSTLITQALTGNLLVTSGSDGIVVVRDGESLEYITRFPVHDYIVGGTCSVGLSPDTSLLTSSGYDGSLVVFDLASLAPLISSRRTRKLKNLPQIIHAKVLEQLNEVDESNGESDPSYIQSNARTSAAGQTLKEKDLQQKILKDELTKSLHTFKLQFNEILSRNANLPELEKLNYNDFAIDLELKNFLIAEGEKRIAAIREQIHAETIGKEYIIQRIKQQCWDAMEVKGQMFTAFKADYDVHNYPIRALPPKEVKRMKQIQFLRKMEIVEKRWRYNQSLKADESDYVERNFLPQKYTEESNAYFMNTELEKPEDGGKEAMKAQEEKDKKNAASGAGKDSKKKDASGAGGSKSSASASGAPGTSAADLPLENLPRFLLYHPLDVITPIKKRTQSFLLNLKIENMKKNFNETFNEFFQVKQKEIDHIHEKAKRIQEIQNELQMDVPVYKPILTSEEIPSSVLTVEDSEIKSPKVLSKAERALADAKAERDRLKAESADDGPERALDVMMGGTLETKRDLSLLEQELVPEEWMKTLTPEQMSDEQKAELAKFEKKVKLIQAEQETRRKLLQTELSKLKSDVADICKSFDGKLKSQLVDHRINVQRELYQHELMIIRLLNDLLVEEDKQKEEQLVSKKIQMLSEAQHVAEALITEFERTHRSSQAQYDSMQAELKNQDRQFRKDLQNGGISVEQQQQLQAEAAAQQQAALQAHAEAVSAALAAGEVDEEGNALVPPPPQIQPPMMGAGENLEVLYKLFRQKKQTKATKSKKAPKMQIDAITGRAVRAGSGVGRLGLLGALGGTQDLGATMTSEIGNATMTSTTTVTTKPKKKKDDEDGDGSMNPYPNDLLTHLSSLYQSQAHVIAPGPNPQLLDDVKYLDLDERDKPDNLDVDLWYVLLERRADYIDKEREVRRYHYKLQEMSLHLQHLQEMQVALSNELQGLVNYQQNLIEARTIFSLNTELMLKIQQGHVEIEESPVVTDLKDCEMIDRVQVEKLNTIIKKQGAEKVDILKDTTVSRTAINLLEWTRKKLELEYADSVDLTTELQLLRVTKSLQGLIKMGGHDNQKAAELKSLDRKIEFVSAANRDSLLGKKLKLMKVKKRIKQQNRENERLYETVQELEAAVKERMQISSIRDEGRLEESRAGKERMKSLVTRRKLVDLAKLQSEEIKFLRDQVENLRRRTFASFAIPQLTPNPDERAKTSYAPSRTGGRIGLLPPASAGGMGSTGPIQGQYVDTSSRPHTTLPGIGNRGSNAAPSGGMLPPISGGNSARDRAVTR